MKKFSLFKTFTGDGLGISKEDKYNEIPTNFLGFFIMLKRKFWNLSSLNLLYVACNFPVFFWLFTMTNQLHEQIYVVANPMFASYRGFELAGADGGVLSMIYPFVSSFRADYLNTPAVYVFLAISALFIITFGLSNTGAAYIIRGYTRGDPIFLISDFFGCIKRNLGQALIIGVIDIAFAVLLIWDFTFWMSQPGFINGVFMYVALFMCVLYFIMRFYVYTIMITFKLSVFKILKDAILLSILGIKRNFLAVLGILVLSFISFEFFALLPSIGIVLPLIITLSVGMFISGYASYPVIKKYMIDPFYADNSDEDEIGDDDEPVFVDRG